MFSNSPDNYRVITQKDGQIIVANAAGLARFDGVRWRLFEHPDRRRGLYALAKAPGQRYCGAFFDDPGCFVAKADGSFEWHSSLHRLAPGDRAAGFCNNVIYDLERKGLWYIYTRHLLFIPDQPSAPVTRAAHPKGFSGSALFAGRLLMASMSKQLIEWQWSGELSSGQSGELVAVPLPEFGVVGTTLRGVVQGPEPESAWVVLMGGQLVQWQAGAVTPIAASHWPAWREVNPQSLLRLNDGNYALAFFRGPLLVLSPQGEILERYGEAQGVPEETTRGMAEDVSGGLWLAQATGVTHIDRGSATRSYGRTEGLGSSADLFHWQGQTWLLSNLGLHRFDVVQAKWQRVQAELARFATHAAIANEQLLVQGSRMLRLDNANQGELIFDTGGAVFASRLGDRAYVAAGAEHFEYFPATDTRRPLPQSAGSFARYVEQDPQTLWAVHRLDQVLRLRRSADGLRWQEPERYAQAQGLPPGALLLEAAEATLWAGTQRGIRRFDEANNQFVLDTRLPEVLSQEAIGALHQDSDGNLWVQTERRLGVAWHESEQSWRWDEQVLRALPATVVVNGFRRIGSELWVLRADGVSRISLAKQTKQVDFPKPFIAQLEALDDARLLPLDVAIEPAPRHLRASFAWPAQARSERVQWRSRILGVDREFSQFDSRSEREWTRLPDGELNLEVQAMDSFGQIVSLAPVRMVIPPPWYRSLWALIGYGLLGLFMLWLAMRFGALRRQRAMQVRQHELEATVAERTQALSRSNQQLAQQAHRLAEVDRLKTRFFINVGHEFRTPLSLVLGPLDDLLREHRERFSERTKNHLQMAHRNAKRVLDLIVELLDVNRFEHGQLELQRAPQDLVMLLKRLSREALALTERHGHHLQLDLAGIDCAYANIDAPQIERALSNLISNAAKFMARGGVMQLQLKRSNNDWLISVTDQGRGIAPTALPHVFDRFFQVEGSDHASGYGIGLSLVREIALAHGGDVTVQSELGVGSVFTLRLAAVAQASVDQVLCAMSMADSATPDSHFANEPVELSAELSAPDPLSSARQRVLIADDHDDLRLRLRELLQHRFEVLEAADGNSAWQLARDELPDLIVSDVMMPGCDGVELTRRVRSHGETAAIGVLLLTAKVGSEHAVTGLKAGANDYLAKPFDASELLARCEAIVAHAKRLQHRLAPAAPPAETSEELGTDARWRERFDQHIAAHLHDPQFGIEALALLMHMDRSNLFRRCKEMLGVSPSDYLRDARLAQGHKLLAQNIGSVSEIAYACGYESLSSFTRAFKTRYGLPPSHIRLEAS